MPFKQLELLIVIPMKGSPGLFQPSSALKTLYERVLICCNVLVLPNKYKKLETEIERKLIDISRSDRYSTGKSSFKSIDSIILRFPQFRDGLKEIGYLFEQYEEDYSNGVIDNIEKLKKCLDALDIGIIRDEEIDNLLCYCNIDENKRIQFNEFIVLLCLIYLLSDSRDSSHKNVNNDNSTQIDVTFSSMIEVFLFFDKNSDGKLKRKEVVKAFNETSPWEKSPSHVTRNRFKEMDFDRDGKVSFKEFLLSFINWIGLHSEDDGPIDIYKT